MNNYNHNTIPNGVKYKVIKGNEFILKAIKDKHQKEIDKYGTKLDSIIVEHNNIHYLILEQTQEEIVEDIKERLKNNISKIKNEMFLTDKEAINLIQGTKHLKYISQFYDNITKMFIGQFPDLSLLYKDLRDPLSQIYNIKEKNHKPKKKLYTNKQGEKIKLPNIDDILRINIIEVIDKLNIEYKKVGGHTYALYENGNWTDGWRATTEKNVVTDLSKDIRAKGNPFAFVRSYLNLSNYNTYLWFKEHFIL